MSQSSNKGNIVYLATRIFDTPLLISRNKLDVILSVLGPRFQLDVDTDIAAKALKQQMTSMHPMPLAEGQEQTEENVRVISVCGTLVHRTMGLNAMSGLTSYQMIQEELEEAMADNNCRGIVMEFDSPGGEANGCFDLADLIAEMKATKPIYAIVNENCHSAAYALASSCTKIFLPRTGSVGSIGVIATHVDQSSKDQKEGLKYTNIFAGAYKADYNPHQPIGDEALARLQAQVNESYKLFSQTVARGRSLKPQQVVDTKAAMFMGKSAVVAGLADGVMSAQDAMRLIVEEVMVMKTDTGPAADALLRAAGGGHLIKAVGDKPAADDADDKKKKKKDAPDTEADEDLDDEENGEDGGEPSAESDDTDDGDDDEEEMESDNPDDSDEEDDEGAAGDDDDDGDGDEEEPDSKGKPKSKAVAQHAGKQPPKGKQYPAGEDPDDTENASPGKKGKKAKLKTKAGASPKPPKDTGAGGRTPAKTPPAGKKQKALATLQAHNAEIVRICALAGAPMKAEKYIKQGLTPTQVRARLFDEVHGSQAVIAGTSGEHLDFAAQDTDPAVLLMKAAGKETQKNAEERDPRRYLRRRSHPVA